MATKTITTKVDDIDGSPAEHTFTFTWQGYKYQIDLSGVHAAEMKADFDKWVSAAHRERSGTRGSRSRAAAAKPEVEKKAAPVAKAETKRTTKPATKAKTAKTAKKPARRRVAAKKPGGPNPALIRAWAEEQGIQVAARGRLAPSLIEQFIVAHTEQPPEVFAEDAFYRTDVL